MKPLSIIAKNRVIFDRVSSYAKVTKAIDVEAMQETLELWRDQNHLEEVSRIKQANCTALEEFFPRPVRRRPSRRARISVGPNIETMTREKARRDARNPT